ncbi:MAG: urease accessory protein UreE [Rhodocyclaceae bacterium]|jgi:urease accessory protein|nr:urease accessory protein UreE [Rhodocyclaceae bacterium]
MILIEQCAASNAEPGARLVLPFDARCKSRLRTRLESGEEVGLFLERGTVLRGGDRLAGNDGRVVEVVAAPEALMEARSEDRMLLARVAYHLGNRHVPVQVGPNWLRFAADHVLGDMVAGLGLPVTELVAAFEPEAGAYASGHSHGIATTPGARIHQYRSGA